MAKTTTPTTRTLPKSVLPSSDDGGKRGEQAGATAVRNLLSGQMRSQADAILNDMGGEAKYAAKRNPSAEAKGAKKMLDTLREKYPATTWGNACSVFAEIETSKK